MATANVPSSRALSRDPAVSVCRHVPTSWLFSVAFVDKVWSEAASEVLDSLVAKAHPFSVSSTTIETRVSHKFLTRLPTTSFLTVVCNRGTGRDSLPRIDVTQDCGLPDCYEAKFSPHVCAWSFAPHGNGRLANPSKTTVLPSQQNDFRVVLLRAASLFPVDTQLLDGHACLSWGLLLRSNPITGSLVLDAPSSDQWKIAQWAGVASRALGAVAGLVQQRGLTQTTECGEFSSLSHLLADLAELKAVDICQLSDGSTSRADVECIDVVVLRQERRCRAHVECPRGFALRLYRTPSVETESEVLEMHSGDELRSTTLANMEAWCRLHAAPAPPVAGPSDLAPLCMSVVAHAFQSLGVE
mmetsp:Transcript_34929/g.79632  ORF Transcript_34929/g.79632 Transcript_34929/m.79632 type:complete len:357 (+) Transcript_34929:56-1126(+)